MLKRTLVSAALAALFLSTALAQHSHEGEVGKFYQTWLRPAGPGIEHRRSPCCNEQDCYAAVFKNVDGVWFFWGRESQSWRVVPESIFEHNQPDPRESPDGTSHVCASPGHVFCAVLGSGQ